MVLVILLILLATVPAAAQDERIVPFAINARIVPPREFDFPFKGTLRVHTIKAIKEVWAMCGDHLRKPVACSQRFTDGSCTIIISSDDVLKQYGVDWSLVFRHEIAHCNGWPGHHPDAQERDDLKINDPKLVGRKHRESAPR